VIFSFFGVQWNLFSFKTSDGKEVQKIPLDTNGSDVGSGEKKESSCALSQKLRSAGKSCEYF